VGGSGARYTCGVCFTVRVQWFGMYSGNRVPIGSSESDDSGCEEGMDHEKRYSVFGVSRDVLGMCG